MTQIITCKCGSVIAVAIEPYCYQDADWQRNMRKYVKKGCIVALVSKKDAMINFNTCKCNEKQVEPSLFETEATP